MIIKTFVAAGALALLSAGAVLAQDATYQSATPYGQTRAQASAPISPEAKDATDASARAGNVTVVDGEVRIPVNADVAAKVGIPVEIVASAPVPDTAANRKLYGGPMSNAGAHTKAAGN